MTVDEYETVIAKSPKPPPKPDPVPTAAQRFWLCVGCAHVAGIAIGMEVTRLIYTVEVLLGRG